MIINEIGNIVNWYKDFTEEHFFFGALLITITVILLYDLILIPSRFFRLVKLKKKEVELLEFTRDHIIRQNIILYTYFALKESEFDKNCLEAIDKFNNDIGAE